MVIVIKGLMIHVWGSKCHQNNSPVICDGYVKYEETEADRLVGILETNNCGGPLNLTKLPFRQKATYSHKV